MSADHSEINFTLEVEVPSPPPTPDPIPPAPTPEAGAEPRELTQKAWHEYVRSRGFTKGF